MTLKMERFEERSAKFLFDASLLYQEKSPELSRFFSQSLLKDKAQQNKKLSNLLQSTSVCPYCYQWLKPDNHRIRLRPKPRPSARLQSILLRKARGKRLSLVQSSLLLRFQNSSSKLMATCHACTKTSRHQGMNREFISFSRTHNTPGSAGKHKTPPSSNRSSFSTPKTPGKDKTPSNTPRSSISSSVSATSSTSSKSSSKAKNWVVQRLSKILLRQDSDSGKKGGLKDFLSSL